MNVSKYEPIIKGRGFCPNPVVKYGIPDFADSSHNPKVEGTTDYLDWWNEQFKRCYEGYKTGGIYIPGRYYFYLNFCFLSTVGRGVHYPEYVDFDHDFFLKVEEAKQTNKGIISLKRRRIGMSHKVSDGIISHGTLFKSEGYRAGVVAGAEIHSEGFFRKFKDSNSRRVAELRLHYLTDNADEWEAGYQEKSSVGFIDAGSRNRVLCRTAKLKSNVFKGEFLDDAVFEEGGEFQNLMDTFNDSKACFMVGTRMVGTPFIYGTGGNIKTASKDFKEFWFGSESYGLIKIYGFGDRMQTRFFIGSVNEKGKVEENCPNIKKLTKEQGLRYEQVLGCEDTQAMIEEIMKVRAELAKAPNKKPYYSYFQDNPLNEKEAFLIFSANPFDADILNQQQYAIFSQEVPKYARYRPEWVMDDEGKMKYPFEVNMVPAPDHIPDSECVLIRSHPVKNYRHLYFSGVDSYDLDQTLTSKSLGAMAVGIDHNSIPNQPSMQPVCVIRCRPRRKEKFYEMCMMTAVYYNLIGEVLIDYSKGLILDHFIKHSGERYLAVRPKSFESPHSQQMHKYGVSLHGESKPKMIALLQSWVLDYALDCWFPMMVEELIHYDVEAKDSDWDLADAWGIALMRKVDRKRKPVDSNDQDLLNRFDPPVFQERNGILENISGKPQDITISDPFLRMLKSGELNQGG